METINNIDLADGTYTSDEIAVTEQFLTIQVQYTSIDGDFEIIPLQANELYEEGVTDPDYDPIYDFKGNPIRYKVEHRDVAAGSKTFNLLDLNALIAKVQVRAIGGKYGATEGTVNLIIKNTA
jgi:hypothetical protein